MISISPLFNSPNADLVLRSTPSLHSPQPVDFLVHRCALSVASPFFDTMFSLPQAPNDAKDTRPVIDVSETAETLEGLLRLIYPMTSPTIKSREQLVLLLDAASKYDVPVALESLSRLLIEPQYMSDPVWVYATASRLDLEEEAKLASRHTLGIDICDCSSREDLAIYDYNRLHDLHQRRSQAALALLQIPDDIKCTLCNLGTHYGILLEPKWWRDFERRTREELRLRPTSDVIFTEEFLSVSAQAGCRRCKMNMASAGAEEFLTSLKKQIDDLPSTI